MKSAAFPRKEASTVVTEMTAALRKEFDFHLPSIFCITFGRIKNIECPAQIPDVAFHKVGVVSASDEL